MTTASASGSETVAKVKPVEAPNLWAAPVRFLLSVLLNRPLVALVDWDGEVNARLVKWDLFGRPVADRFGFGIRRVTLKSDGTLIGGRYVVRWVPVRGNPFGASA